MFRMKSSRLRGPMLEKKEKQIGFRSIDKSLQPKKAKNRRRCDPISPGVSSGSARACTSLTPETISFSGDFLSAYQVIGWFSWEMQGGG